MDTVTMDASPPPAPPPASRRLEHAVADLPAHLVAGIKILRRWQDDSLVTDAEVQAAVTELLSIRIG